MATATITVPLTDDLKAYVEAQVEAGPYGTPAEYVRELILDHRDRRLARLEDRLLADLASEPIEVTEEEWESPELVEILRSKLKSAA